MPNSFSAVAAIQILTETNIIINKWYYMHIVIST